MMWEGVNTRCARIHGPISWKGHIRRQVDRGYVRQIVLQSNCYCEFPGVLCGQGGSLVFSTLVAVADCQRRTVPATLRKASTN